MQGIDGREYVSVLDENDCTTKGIAVTNAEIYGSSDGNTTPAEATENDVYYTQASAYGERIYKSTFTISK